MISDVGLHFRCYRLWAYWLKHVPTTRKVSTLKNYFPGGHGKTKLDGCFGKQQRWTEEAALRQNIASVEDLAAVFNDRAAKAAEQNLTAATTEFIAWTPPQKSSLWGMTLDGAAMRASKINCQGTHALSAEVVGDGRSPHQRPQTYRQACSGHMPRPSHPREPWRKGRRGLGGQGGWQDRCRWVAAFFSQLGARKRGRCYQQVEGCL